MNTIVEEARVVSMMCWVLVLLIVLLVCRLCSWVSKEALNVKSCGLARSLLSGVVSSSILPIFWSILILVVLTPTLPTLGFMLSSLSPLNGESIPGGRTINSERLMRSMSSPSGTRPFIKRGRDLCRSSHLGQKEVWSLKTILCPSH